MNIQLKVSELIESFGMSAMAKEVLECKADPQEALRFCSKIRLLSDKQRAIARAALDALQGKQICMFTTLRG